MKRILRFPGRRPALAVRARHVLRGLPPVLMILHRETSTRVASATRCGRSATRSTSGVRGLAIPCRNSGPSCRCGDFRWSDERQRSRRLRSPRDRLDRGATAGTAAVHGICLGAQMLAKQLGAGVAPHPQGRAQIGYYPIRPTAVGLALSGLAGHVYHWHREGFELPAGAELLAEGSDFPVEAIQSGSRVRLPVSSRRDLRDDASLDHARLRAPRPAPGARERHHHFADRAVHDVIERAWLEAISPGLVGPRADAIDGAQAAE